VIKYLLILSLSRCINPAAFEDINIETTDIEIQEEEVIIIDTNQLIER
jgi:hypothetical protein